jgi:hypothetical protein
MKGYNMKKLIQVQELDGQGLEALLGKNVFFFGTNYNYYGKLIGVNDHDILLQDAGICFETGAFDGNMKDFQKFPCKEWRVRTAAIESYGELCE